MPSTPPTMRPIRGAKTPTVSDIRAPWMSLESMSRPRRSVPSQCAALGGMRRSIMSMSFGVGSGSTFASAAAKTTIPIQPAANQKSTPKLGWRQVELSAGAVTAMPASLVRMADPGIEHRVEHVDEKIDQHESGGHEQYDALQDHEVARIDGTEQEPADPRQGKDGLHDDRATDQPADIDAGHRDQCEGGWLQRVHEQDAPRLQALGLGHGDVVFLQGGNHIGTQHTHQHRPLRERQC